MTERAKNFDELIKSASVEQRQLVERVLGDAKTLNIPEGRMKELLFETLQGEIKQEVKEHVREEKREDERRDERRDGTRGEKPANPIATPPAGTKPVNPAEPKK